MGKLISYEVEFTRVESCTVSIRAENEEDAGAPRDYDEEDDDTEDDE